MKPTALGACQRGESPVKKCGCLSAGIHRKGALGMVLNPIKHEGTQKVAVTTKEGYFSARETQNCRLFTKS